RRRLRQRLVESPAGFRAELPDDGLDVLSRERTELARQLDENFGVGVEGRAEGVLAYGPASGGGRPTDVDFPGSGSAKQAALLLLDELNAAPPPLDAAVMIGSNAVPALLVSWARVDTVLGDLASRHRAAWKGGYADSPDLLRTEVADLL